MPRPIDLKREARIRELRSHGFRIRQIAREVGASPATVSRTLQKEPTRQFLAVLTHRVEIVEAELASCRAALAILAKRSIQWGRMYRDPLLNILLKWPGTFFNQLQIDRRL